MKNQKTSLALAAVLSPLCAQPAHAGPDSDAAKFASGAGTVVYLAAGTLLPLIEDGKAGKEHSLRSADALMTSVLLSEALKQVVHERRPDGSDNKSFPSTHATAAFAIATMQSEFHPRQKLLWYGGATAIAASRVSLDKHHWHDVAAGALLGFATAKFELKRPRGLLLQPFIRPAGAGKRTAGLQITRSF